MNNFKGIIVACSRKKGGYCVVTWDENIGFKRLVWVPKQGYVGDELPRFTVERQGHTLKVGDVVEVYPDKRVWDRDEIQPENLHLWQEAKFWGFHKAKNTPRYSNEGIVRNIFPVLPQNKGNLFGAPVAACRMTREDAIAAGRSFEMAKVENLVFKKDIPSREDAEPRVLASFSFNGAHYYDVRVTIGEKASDIKEFADRKFKEAYIALSLTQPYEFDEMCYVCLCAFYGGKEA